MATLIHSISGADALIEVNVAVIVASGYPWRFTLDSEVVYVTGASGTELSIERGADGTTATSHGVGTTLTSAPLGAAGPVGPAGASIVTDGTTTVNPATKLTFPSGGIVTGAAGEAKVTGSATVTESQIQLHAQTTDAIGNSSLSMVANGDSGSYALFNANDLDGGAQVQVGPAAAVAITGTTLTFNGNPVAAGVAASNIPALGEPSADEIVLNAILAALKAWGIMADDPA